MVEHSFFGENSLLLDVFWPRPRLQANHGTAKKVQYSRDQETKNSLNEAILLMSINEALLLRLNFVSFG